MPRDDRLRVFFDADALIAGGASATGASHLLLRMSELGLILGLTSRQALQEAQRNMGDKLPLALDAFRATLAAAELTVLPDADESALSALQEMAHPDDLPILAAALAGQSDYLTTFNLRHYHIPADRLHVVRPGDLVARIRRALLESL